MKPTKNSGDFSIGCEVWPGTSKLLEEMGELQQVLGKLLGSSGEITHWDGSNLRERLKEELADVLAAATFFQDLNFDSNDDDDIRYRVEEKRKLFMKWHNDTLALKCEEKP